MAKNKKGPGMQKRRPACVPKEMPIERIFRKVVGRKMTPAERLSFHLHPDIGPAGKQS